jgi:O-antigen ligase
MYPISPLFTQSRILSLLIVLAFGIALWSPFSALASLPLLAGLLIPLVRNCLYQKKNIPDLIMMGWAVWLPINVIVSVAMGISLNYAGALVTMPLAYFCGRAIFYHESSQKIFRIFLWLLLGCMSVISVIEDPWPFHDPKAQGPFNDPNLLAAFLNLLFLPLVHGYLAGDIAKTSSYRRMVKLLILGSTLLSLFMISSRGSMLSLIIFVPILAWVSRRTPDFPRKIVVLGIVICVSYAFAFWVKQGAGTAITRLVYTVTSGDSGRLMMVRSTWEMIKEHPWLGTGLGTFRLFYPVHREFNEIGSAGGWAHNDYLQFWQEGGLPLFMILILLSAWLVGRIIKGIWVNANSSENPKIGVTCGALSACLQANFNFVIYAVPVTLIMGLYVSMIAPTQFTLRTSWKSGFRDVLLKSGVALALWFLVPMSLVTMVYEKDLGSHLAGNDGVISRYDLALILSILAPYYPTPHHVMAQELLLTAKKISMEKGHGDEVVQSLRREAIAQLRETRRAVPCYLPYSIDELKLSIAFAHNNGDRESIRPLVSQNLACNPRHGLTYYYAGILENELGNVESAVAIWKRGQTKVLYHSERLMLLATLLSANNSKHKLELMQMVASMADSLETQESKPDSHLDTTYWFGVQDRLRMIDTKALDEVLVVTQARNRAI